MSTSETIRCPKCGHPMVQFQAGEGKPETLGTGAGPAGEVVLDRCATCRGTWFDGMELAHVFGFKPGTVDVEGTTPARRKVCPACNNALPPTADRCPICTVPAHVSCPRCNVPLLNGQVASLPVQTCPQCFGVFIDPDKLGQIIRAYGEGASSAPAGPHTCERCGRSGLTDAQITNTGSEVLCEVCFRDGEAMDAVREQERQHSEGAHAFVHLVFGVHLPRRGKGLFGL